MREFAGGDCPVDGVFQCAGNAHGVFGGADEDAIGSAEFVSEIGDGLWWVIGIKVGVEVGDGGYIVEDGYVKVFFAQFGDCHYQAQVGGLCACAAGDGYNFFLVGHGITKLAVMECFL